MCPQLLELGEKLIRAGLMYADDTPVEAMREQRLKGVESACRHRTVEENLTIWEEMKAGSEVGLTNAMRFKIDMKVRFVAGSWRYARCQRGLTSVVRGRYFSDSILGWL